MYCNQIFSLCSATETENVFKIENRIVADNYETANNVARMQYGENAIAVETTDYPVDIEDTYDSHTGKFYRGETEIVKNQTADEKIAELEELNNELLTTLDTLMTDIIPSLMG